MDDSKKKVKTVALPRVFLHDQTGNVNQQIEQEIEQGNKEFVVDASRLETIDSFGIGFLVETLKKLRNEGGNLYINGLSGEPLKSLRKSNLDMLFSQDGMEDSISADKGFPSQSRTGDQLKFQMQHESRDDVSIFHLSGILCFPDGARKFKQELLFAVSDQKKIVLDFEGLKYLDSLSINEIVVFYRTISTSGGEIRYCNANELIRDIFHRQGLDQLVHECKTLADALQDW